MSGYVPYYLLPREEQQAETIRQMISRGYTSIVQPYVTNRLERIGPSPWDVQWKRVEVHVPLPDIEARIPHDGLPDFHAARVDAAAHELVVPLRRLMFARKKSA